MYCYHTELQYKYKKLGCRESDNDQSLDDLKRWNFEIADQHNLLEDMTTFSVHIVSLKKVLLTGCNVRLSFQTFTLCLNALFCTTVSQYSTYRFCDFATEMERL